MEGSNVGVVRRAVMQQLSILAAELQEPLQYITATTTYLSENPDSDNLQEYLSDLALTSQRVLRAQQLMLLREQVVTGRQQVIIEPVNLAAMARSAMLDAARHRRDIAVDLIHVTYEATPALADRFVLKHIFDSLGDVLVQSTGPQSEMQARVVRRNKRVQLEIIDDGPVIKTSKTAMLQTHASTPHNNALSLIAIKDLIHALQGTFSLAATTDNKRHCCISFPMTTQLSFLL